MGNCADTSNCGLRDHGQDIFTVENSTIRLMNRAPTMAWLNAFISKNSIDDDMTTSEVVSRIIVPQTASSRVSYAELSSSEGFGHATLFVSHAWRCPFKKLIDALAEIDGKDDSPHHFWIDIFAITQHAGPAQEAELKSLGNVVVSCGCTVAVLEPWNSPQLVSRLWCLFELMKTMQVGANNDGAHSPHTAPCARFHTYPPTNLL